MRSAANDYYFERHFAADSTPDEPAIRYATPLRQIFTILLISPPDYFASRGASLPYAAMPRAQRQMMPPIATPPFSPLRRHFLMPPRRRHFLHASPLPIIFRHFSRDAEPFFRHFFD